MLVSGMKKLYDGLLEAQGLTDGEELDHLADLVRADGTWVYYGVRRRTFLLLPGCRMPKQLKLRLTPCVRKAIVWPAA